MRARGTTAVILECSKPTGLTHRADTAVAPVRPWLDTGPRLGTGPDHVLFACAAIDETQPSRPDFPIRLTDGTALILEVKAFETEEDREKHSAAHRWVDAVNNWRELGK